jgi:hypothetical protein
MTERYRYMRHAIDSGDFESSLDSYFTFNGGTLGVFTPLAPSLQLNHDWRGASLRTPPGNSISSQHPASHLHLLTFNGRRRLNQWSHKQAEISPGY